VNVRVSIDDDLVEQARRLGRHKTKRDAVNAALKEYVQRRKQMSIVDLFGKVEYWADYDH
jgi:Arc/MetJ family transcription regulator